MWLLRDPRSRRAQDDLGLGASTALVAGLVNVCSVMSFFAFSSNVTGHVATFAEEAVKGHWHQGTVLLTWICMFVVGAFLANLSVTLLGQHRRHAGHAAPLLLQALGLASVAYYGHHHYLETLRETELLVGVLLLTMGLQNGTVASVSNSVVRTTHLTGLLTDLAMELSMILQRRFRGDATLRFRLTLHLVVLLSYLLGGLIGGITSMVFGLRALYLACALLSLVLLHDLSALRHGATGRNRRAARTARAPDVEPYGGATRFE